MWSDAILRCFSTDGQMPQATVSQRLPAFPLHPPRIAARHSQIKRDTTFATPGYLILFPYGSGMGHGLLTHTVTHIILTLISTFSRGHNEIPHLFRRRKHKLFAYSVLPNQARYQLRYTRIFDVACGLLHLPNNPKGGYHWERNHTTAIYQRITMFYISMGWVQARHFPSVTHCQWGTLKMPIYYTLKMPGLQEFFRCGILKTISGK